MTLLLINYLLLGFINIPIITPIKKMMIQAMKTNIGSEIISLYII